MIVDLFNTHVLLGKVKGSGAPVWYLAIEFIKHMLILGRTGSGKTTLLYWIISQLINRCGVWIFDRKEDFRHLLRLYPDILVFDLKNNFRCNPLQPPPYVDPKSWMTTVLELWCMINGMLGLSLSLLGNIGLSLIEGRSANDNSKDYPSLHELLAALKKEKISRYGTAASSRESLCRRFEFLLNANKDLYDCSIGFNIEKLLNKIVVFELSGLTQSQADFWTNFFLRWLFQYRIAKKERGNQLRNAVVLDEAKAVFSPFENPNLGFSPMTYMVSMLREFGVGIIAADQTAQLNNSIFANSQLKVLFSLGSGEDLLKAARSMGLSPEQAAYTHNLGVGEAIVRHQKIGKTFVLQIPKFPLE